jgi:hypothetical protein
MPSRGPSKGRREGRLEDRRLEGRFEAVSMKSRSRLEGHLQDRFDAVSRAISRAVSRAIERPRCGPFRGPSRISSWTAGSCTRTRARPLVEAESRAFVEKTRWLYGRTLPGFPVERSFKNNVFFGAEPGGSKEFISPMVSSFRRPGSKTSLSVLVPGEWSAPTVRREPLRRLVCAHEGLGALPIGRRCSGIVMPRAK